MSKVLVGITDEFSPEVQAMLIAMYSRSLESIEDRLPNTAESEEEHKEKFGKFYVGYGHKSVGQLGYTTVWLEGISMLAAKAIENNRLFNGQECSTRYIDFSTVEFKSTTMEMADWNEKWRAFYVENLPLVVEHLKKQFPYEDQQNDKDVSGAIWLRTINARAFDIMRGFLPAGATTNLAFVGSFDVLVDHFSALLYHPLDEVRSLASIVLTTLKTKYEYSTPLLGTLSDRNLYKSDHEFHYQKANLNYDTLKIAAFGDVHSELYTRKEYEQYPSNVSNALRFDWTFMLDFGSYRDIHRHRSGVITMPLLTTELGFNQWYLDNLPEDVKIKAQSLLFAFGTFINDIYDTNKFDSQYCIPMGYNVRATFTADLNAICYIAELRSKKTVHQTLRKEVIKLVKEIRNRIPSIPIYADLDDDNWTMKRGTETFVK